MHRTQALRTAALAAGITVFGAGFDPSDVWAGAPPKVLSKVPQKIAPATIGPKLGPKIAAATRGTRRVAPKPVEERCEGIRLPQKQGPLPFKPGEELAYELSVAGVYVGRFETKVGRPRTVEGKSAISLFGRARTNSFLSTFQKFAGRYMTLVDASTLRPVGLQVEATYGDDRRWEKARFTDRERSLAASFLYQGKEGTRSYTAQDPLTDVLTMLYFARTRVIPEEGLDVCQEVFGARWLWTMRAKVGGIEDVDTPAGKKKARRVTTVFQRAMHPELTPQQRAQKFEMDVLFAQDDTQAPLAFVIRTDKFTADGKLIRWSLEDEGDQDWEF